MRAFGAYPAVWLTVGVWLPAILLGSGILAVQLSARVPPAGSASVSARQAATVSGEEDAGRSEARPTGDVRLKISGGAPGGAPPRWPRRPDNVVDPAGPEAGPREATAPREPGPVVHRVEPGETLIRIARGYLGPAADWEAVAHANLIQPPYTLRVGQEVTIAGAGSARSAAKVSLLPPVEKEAEAALRTALAAEVNSPPAHAFRPLEDGLRLRHPLWEAFPWKAFALGVGVFALAVVAAGTYALETAPGRMRPRRAVRILAWAAAPAGGMFFLAAGLGTLAASPTAGVLAAEVVLGAAVAALAGLAAYLGARTAPGADEPPAPGVALRFAAAMTLLLAAASTASALAGWTTRLLQSLTLPG